MRIPFLFALLALSSPLAHADGTPLSDAYFKMIDEAGALDRATLGTPEHQTGVLFNAFNCIQSHIATDALANVVEREMNLNLQYMAAKIRELPFGSRVMDEMLRENPHILEFHVERQPYAQACAKEIAAAKANPKVTADALAREARLGEAAGVILGKYITSGL